VFPPFKADGAELSQSQLNPDKREFNWLIVFPVSSSRGRSAMASKDGFTSNIIKSIGWLLLSQSTSRIAQASGNFSIKDGIAEASLFIALYLLMLITVKLISI
jgi:hypothetical protein